MLSAFEQIVREKLYLLVVANEEKAVHEQVKLLKELLLFK
jgi:hypothetical protein